MTALRNLRRRLEELTGIDLRAERGGLSDGAERRELISVFDTTVSDNNLGNAIIMDAVYEHLHAMFPMQFFIKLPFADSIGHESVRYIQQSRHVFFGGTNSLSSEMERYKQWGIDAQNVDRIRGVILMGLGWWQYQTGVSAYTRRLLGRVLHPTLLHSVRDSYTEAKMREAGFRNVINTSCPTTWNLTEEHCAAIPRGKAAHAVVAFTNYAQKPDRDAGLLRALRRSYERLFLWVQGPEDLSYARRMDAHLELIPPRLEALDALLASELDLDYVGTRLHAGIRALQFKRRAIIAATDNRATEIGKDIGLEVIPRDDVERIAARVDSTFETRLKVPFESVRTWKAQFQGAA